MLKQVTTWLLNEHGIWGLVVIVLGAVIMYMFREAKKERQEARKEHLAERDRIWSQSKEHFKTMIEVTKDSTSALKGIETLVQSIDRRTGDRK